MQQLIPGTGWLARAPKTLSLRSGPAGLGLGSAKATEQLSSTVITARLMYGGLGTCPSGSLTVVDAPPGWTDDGLDCREVLLDLSSELGQHTVYRAVLSEAARDGRLTTATLTGIHLVWADGPAQLLAHPLSSPLLPETRDFGVALGLVSNEDWSQGRSSRDVLESRLAPYPDADWGAHPSGVGVTGQPRAGTPVHVSSAVLDYQYGELTAPKWNRTPYATHAVLRPGAPYAAQFWSRPGGEQLSPLTPRRIIEVSATPATITVAQTATAAVPGAGGSAPILADGQVRTYSDWQLAAITPHVIQVPPVMADARPVSARVRIPYTLSALSGQNGAEAGMYLTIRTDTQQGTQTLVKFGSTDLGLTQNLDIDFQQDTLQGASTIEVLLAPAYQSTADSMTLQVAPIVATFQMEKVNSGGIVIPLALTMPTATGPFRELVLNGCWLVPPAYEDDLGQFASGVEIVWRADTATTRVFFGPLPYPGQKRGNT